GVPTYLQFVHQVGYALRLGFLRQGDQLPRIKDVTRTLAVNPDTVMKAYRELELRGVAGGRPGVGTVITQAAGIAGLERVAGWLGEAAAAGVDEVGMKALFTAALRDFNDGGGPGRLPGRGGRGGGVARGAGRDGGAA